MLPVESSKCLTAVRNDALQKGKVLFAVVLRCKMGDIMYVEKADMHYMYFCTNGNEKVTIRMYHLNPADYPPRSTSASG